MGQEVKKIVLGSLIFASVASSGKLDAQNAEGQIIAAQYGQWKVRGQSPNDYSFVLNDCQQTAGSQTFHPFAKNAPIRIVDADPSKSETVTPALVIDNAQTCAVTMQTINEHNSFSLQSATGGLQEALNANSGNPVQTTVLLTPAWYLQGGSTALIATVTGNANLGIVDVTTSPYTAYAWNGTQYGPSGVTLDTTTAQPSCTAAYRGMLWTVQGNGTTTQDVLQQCQLTAAGAYVWHSF